MHVHLCGMPKLIQWLLFSTKQWRLLWRLLIDLEVLASLIQDL